MRKTGCAPLLGKPWHVRCDPVTGVMPSGNEIVEGRVGHDSNRGEQTMRKRLMPIAVASTLSVAALPRLLAQATAIERNCPSSRGIAEAIPPFVGSGKAPFSPNQSLCLPQLAPTPTGLSPLAFIVQGVEPGARVDAQGT